MKKILIIILIFLGLSLKGNCQEVKVLKDFFKHLVNNYKVPETFKKDCYFNYAAVLIKTNDHNKITEVKVINAVDMALTNSLQFLNGYEFSSRPNLKKGPILFFIVYDWKNDKGVECEDSFWFGSSTTKVFSIGLETVDNQLKNDPTTKVIYNPMVVNLNSPIIN